MSTETVDVTHFIQRRFTHPDVDVWDSVEWGTRDVEVGKFSFSDIEAPVEWTDQAVGVVAKLYFATIKKVREKSIRGLIERVVDKIVEEGRMYAYFGVEKGRDEIIETFRAELIYILLHQMAAFNTPVWLNFGVPGRRQVASACFLLSVDDTMVGDNGITSWWSKEALIFKGGAGSGVNVSNLRGSMEELSTGGLASGPCAYMRTADSGAGTLKSGGAHRRAAKMVCINDDHPDVLDFIQLKPREDDRMRALIAAGFDLDPTTSEGERLIAECTTCQNENVSIRLSDLFMKRAENDGDWPLVGRKSGKTTASTSAKRMLHEIAEASWKCADPGILFNDTINSWHTTPEQGPITTCNPCAEVHQNDDTACNLASINLLKFVIPGDEIGKPRRRTPDHFDVNQFCHVVDVMTTAMDITCSFSDLPTPEIEQNVRDLRQLGLGYCNLGAALMVQGMPYDSHEGRDWTSAVTALMTGRAYRRSGELARQLGPFEHFEENSDAMMRVMAKHADAMTEAVKEDWSNPIWEKARKSWNDAIAHGLKDGFRNAQASVIAPTGTISFMMGADTTGCEPSIALRSYKGLASGGTITMVNGSVERALNNLGYSKDQIANMIDEIRLHGTPTSVRMEDRPIFATALGDNAIAPSGHIQMIAAIQPFISGASSKTVNLPEETTVEEITQLYINTWHMGIKALAIYREGSKTTSVISLKEKKDIPVLKVTALIPPESIPAEHTPEEETPPDWAPQRKRLPVERRSLTHKFSIDGHEGYVTAGMWEDGTLGEIFMNGIGKEGSTLKGMMDAWATAVSISFQYGVPLEIYARKFTNMNFEPHGATTNPEIMAARSIVDYIMRWLVSRFGDQDLCEELGVLTPEVKRRLASRLDEGAVSQGPVATAVVSTNGHDESQPDLTGPVCRECGGVMKRTGTCYTCSCGNNTGCG